MSNINKNIEEYSGLIKNWVVCLIKRPKTFLFRLQYAIYQFLHPDYPWLTQKANSFLKREIRPWMKGFEWGSGRSTREKTRSKNNV